MVLGSKTYGFRRQNLWFQKAKPHVLQDIAQPPVFQPLTDQRQHGCKINKNRYKTNNSNYNFTCSCCCYIQALLPVIDRMLTTLKLERNLLLLRSALPLCSAKNHRWLTQLPTPRCAHPSPTKGGKLVTACACLNLGLWFRGLRPSSA